MQLNPYDFVRIQAQLDLQCMQCGVCCIDTDPIDLFPKDIRRIASYLNISEEKTIQEYTIPHPTIPGRLALRGLPCRFYDQTKRKCKIYRTCSIGYQLLGFCEQICQSRHAKIIRINISNIFKKTNF